MTFDKKVHDFGTIDDGTPVETIFFTLIPVMLH